VGDSGRVCADQRPRRVEVVRDRHQRVEPCRAQRGRHLGLRRHEDQPVLSRTERAEGFEFLQRDDAESFFLQLNVRDRANLVLGLPAGERRLWMRLLAPDDAADLLQ